MVVDRVKKIFLESNQISELIAHHPDDSSTVEVTGLVGSARAFAVASVFEKLDKNILCLLPTQSEALDFYQDLIILCDEKAVQFYPAHDRQVWSEVGPLSADVGRKMRVLRGLFETTEKIFVSSPQALMEKVANPEKALDNKISLEAGLLINFAGLIEKLVGYGYVREDRVDRPGEMSVRGGIIDVFLFEYENPFRVEFFGDEIESIREFNVETQRSIQRCTILEIYPLSIAGPFGPFDEQPIEALPFDCNFLDWIKPDTIIFSIDPPLIAKEFEDYEKQVSVRLESFIEEHSLDDLPFFNYYSSIQVIEKRIAGFPGINVKSFSQTGKRVVHFNTISNGQFGGNLGLFKKEMDKDISLLGSGAKGLFALLCDSEAQENRIRELFQQEGIATDLKIETANLSSGFQWTDQNLSIYTNREIYGRVRPARRDKLESRSIALRELAKINIGDFVVHTDYGVGIYRGLKKIKAYGKKRECLKIEYQDGDMLYVPLEKMDLVQKYSSKEGVVPHLSKLGTAAWEKLKKRTKENVKEVAKKLIKLYAVRRMRPGCAFSKDSIWQKELEASFQYEETIDQFAAINDVKNDMEKSRPMDRLICGDVGFGKTEVAIRASFKAINDGKQVAVLVPTTILAQQHFTTFSERLSRFPIKIEMLSRFKSKKEQSEIVNKLSTGEIDLIIGTHRILSKDINFSNLGLLIIDEEQKFGVMHKEKLKLIKESVDTLSLSATPIPRTMHMSLMGAKDLSIINSPPTNRIPIKTEICRFDKEFLREVILQEIDRGGQVFFVHNRVQSIYGIANVLREILPEITISVAHGQMKSHDLEKIMMSFTNGKIQCLVSTMIIESGIDMPRANTLIVNRADRFGLSQLYQLRGRVGRSDQQAFAYFLIPPVKKLTRTAIKRLQTIQELTHFGSGYKVAMRDLEIRGTGNIFGASQSGFVDALGYDLYTKIIEETIQGLKEELNMLPAAEKNAVPEVDSKIEISVDAFLPDDYVRSGSERVDIYRRLVESKSEKGILELQTEVEDRFGKMPEAAQNLFDYVLAKRLAKMAKVEKLSFKENRIEGKFAKEWIPAGEQFRPWLGRIIQSAGDKIELKQDENDLFFTLKFNHKEEGISTAKKFLQSII